MIGDDEQLLASPHLYIDGTWVAPVGGGTRQIRNPADGTVIAVVDEAGSADVSAAVAAARLAFDAGRWSTRPPTERAELLLRVAELLDTHRDALARIETLDTGKTLHESHIDIDDVIAVFRYYADLVTTDSDRLVDTGNPAVVSRVVHEPVGVCALIAPWNYPDRKSVV